MSRTAAPVQQNPPRRRVAVRPNRADQAFLAPALEVLETPPSPIRMALILVLCACVVAALAWAWLGRIDIVAVAQGKIQPTGRVKIVQPVEAGRVLNLHVSNGRRVNEGDVLVELDPEELLADENAVAVALAAFRAEAARRRVVATLAATRDFSFNPPVLFDADAPMVLREREMAALTAEIGKVTALLAASDAQIQQKYAERHRIEDAIANLKKLVSTLRERVTMRSTLAGNQAGTRGSLLDATEALQQQEMQLGNAEGQLAETTANIDVLAKEAEKLLRGAFSENTLKLGDAERQIDDLAQKQIKARARVRHMTLLAPISGTVQALTITNPGQVVAVGQDVLRVVPDLGSLEIEVYLANKDIGFVHLNQEATVKIESFPFTRYGTLNARITRVATDAIPEPDAAQIEGNAAKSLNSNIFAGAQRTQNLVFPITLVPEAAVIHADGVDIPLLPGMAVNVEIKTGNRRIIDYLFSPLSEVTSESMRER